MDRDRQTDTGRQGSERTLQVAVHVGSRHLAVVSGLHGRVGKAAHVARYPGDVRVCWVRVVACVCVGVGVRVGVVWCDVMWWWCGGGGVCVCVCVCVLKRSFRSLLKS